MKRTILIIFILVALLLIKVNVYAQGETILPPRIVNMSPINNFPAFPAFNSPPPTAMNSLKVCLEQNYLKVILDAYSFKGLSHKAINGYSSQLIKEVISELKEGTLDLPAIEPIKKISDSIETEAGLLSKYADKYI